ncbi:MAG: hypothetical protein V3T83_10755 [Acidobacteriota bacterium]
MTGKAAKALLMVLVMAAGIAIGWTFSGLRGPGDGELTRERVKRIFGEFGLQQYDNIQHYNVTSDGLLQVGDRAPDLELEQIEGGSSRISDYYRDKPLLLTFGSYT